MSCNGTLLPLEILVQWGEVHTWLERNSRVFCCSSIKSRISFLVLLVYVVMACWMLPDLHSIFFKFTVTNLIMFILFLDSIANTEKGIYMLKHILHQECFSSCMSFAVISHGTVHFSLSTFLTLLCSFWFCRDASSKSSTNVRGSSSTALFMSYLRRMTCDRHITFCTDSN